MDTCDRCGREIKEEESTIQIIPPGEGTTPLYLCEECAEKANEYFKVDTEKPSTDLLIGKSIVYGLVSAILCSAIWYGCVVFTHFQFGFVAVGVGYIVAFAVCEGSQTINGHKLKWVSAGCTTLAMIISQYLIAHHYLTLYLTANGYMTPALIQPLGEIWYILYTDILSDPSSIFFWLLAISEAYVLPIRWRPRA